MADKITPIKPTDVSRAIVNSPVAEFTLGDRTFRLVDLPYDDYLLFASHLTPLLEVVFGSLAGVMDVNVTPKTSITAASVIEYAGSSLPELVRIVCSQTDPDISIGEIKKMSLQGSPKGPFKLAEIVLKQIEQNKIINDFASFFGQMLPLMKNVLSLSL
jgi:hypothetical protein